MKQSSYRKTGGGGIAAILLACSAILAGTPNIAMGADTSDPAFVFLRPETSFLWCTATNNVMSLPVAYPYGASSATLTVSGLGYSASYPGITAGEFLLTLPAATTPFTENVYNLTLTFDDGTVRTAMLGVIQGTAAGAEGATRCLAPAGSHQWRTVDGQAVFPVPYGVTAFSIAFSDAGTVTESGLDGAAGWYALALAGRRTAMLGMTDANGTEWLASLKGSLGITISFR